jgi:hypothetical protein
MPPRHARVLVDTNAIQAAHRYGCWNSICKCYQLETAEHCIEEALRPNRRGKRLVDRNRDDLKKEILAHAVKDSQRAVLLHTLQGRVDLDDGERDLLSIALTLKAEAWWLCGPDKATIYAMHLLGIIERMSSLQALIEGAGQKIPKLEDQFTEKWLSSIRTQLLLTGKLI